MKEHVNVEELLRFHDGSADPRETMAVGRHLAECSRCAALAQEMFRDEGPRAFASSLRSEPVRRPWGRLLAVAAALLVIAGAAALWLMHRPAGAPAKPTIARTATAPNAEPYDRPEWNALVRDALAHGVTIAVPAAAADNGALRGSANALDGEMTPSATAVESPRPELTWPAVAGATFVVSVVEGDDVVARSGTLVRNRWVPEQPLPRGRTYAWQVRVTRDSGAIDTLPAPPRSNPRFRVLADDEARDLAAARARYPDDHLLLGVLAAHYGLRDDARRELAQTAVKLR